MRPLKNQEMPKCVFINKAGIQCSKNCPMFHISQSDISVCYNHNRPKNLVLEKTRCVHITKTEDGSEIQCEFFTKSKYNLCNQHCDNERSKMNYEVKRKCKLSKNKDYNNLLEPIA